MAEWISFGMRLTQDQSPLDQKIKEAGPVHYTADGKWKISFLYHSERDTFEIAMLDGPGIGAWNDKRFVALLFTSEYMVMMRIEPHTEYPREQWENARDEGASILQISIEENPSSSLRNDVPLAEEPNN